MSDIRQFRRAVALLKKRGLITGKTRAGYPVDARSATPNLKVNGRSLKSIVDKYDDVVSGKKTPLKVSPSKVKALRKAGYETAHGMVLVPHTATEKAIVEQGEIVLVDATGFQRVQLPVEMHDLPKYLKSLQRNKKKINSMKRNNEYFGIRFYGNHRGNTYRTIEALLEDLGKYESVRAANTNPKQEEIFQNLEIIKLSPKDARRWEKTATERRRKRSAEKSRESRRRFDKKLKRKPAAVRNAYKAAAARRMREYRARLKKNIRKYSKYLKNSRKRAAQSKTALDKAVKKQTRAAQSNARKALKSPRKK